MNVCQYLPNFSSNSTLFNIFYQTASDLQRLATGIILTVVNRKLVTDDWRVHAGVDRALALCHVVVPIQSQVCGVEACPLSRAQVDLQGDGVGATVDCQVRIVYERRNKKTTKEIQMIALIYVLI